MSTNAWYVLIPLFTLSSLLASSSSSQPGERDREAHPKSTQHTCLTSVPARLRMPLYPDESSLYLKHYNKMLTTNHENIVKKALCTLFDWSADEIEWDTKEQAVCTKRYRTISKPSQPLALIQFSHEGKNIGMREVLGYINALVDEREIKIPLFDICSTDEDEILKTAFYLSAYTAVAIAEDDDPLEGITYSLTKYIANTTSFITDVLTGTPRDARAKVLDALVKRYVRVLIASSLWTSTTVSTFIVPSDYLLNAIYNFDALYNIHSAKHPGTLHQTSYVADVAKEATQHYGKVDYLSKS